MLSSAFTAGLVVGWRLQNLVMSPRGLVPKGDGGSGEEGGQSGCCDATRLTACLCLVPAGEERGQSCAHRQGTVPITGWPHPDADPTVLVCTAIRVAQAGLGPERLDEVVSATGSGISERRHPFPLLFGGLSTDVLHSVVLRKSRLRLRAHRIVELIFPFCKLSLLTLGSCGWCEKPVIIHFYYIRWSPPPQPGAESAQRASLPACGPSPGKGLLVQEQVSRRQQSLHHRERSG